MTQVKILRSLILLAVLFFPLMVSAETIFLKNGMRIEGKIIKYNDESILLETTINETPRTFLKKDIFQINFDEGSAASFLKKKQRQNSKLVYLKNGEIIRGKITQYNPDFITVESLKGQGVLQLPTNEVTMISSGSSDIDLSQRTAVGYVQSKSTLNSSDGPSAYSSDQISYKIFLDDTLFNDFLLAFGNAKFGKEVLSVLSFDYRIGMVFRKVRNTLLYYGGSAGYLQIKDSRNKISGSGVALKGFLGAEMFFTSMPNFGFSGEIGLGMKRAGNYSSTDISSSSFPSFSIHYYF